MGKNNTICHALILAHSRIPSLFSTIKLETLLIFELERYVRYAIYIYTIKLETLLIFELERYVRYAIYIYRYESLIYMYNICITISGAAQSNELAPTADETRMSGSRSEWFAGFHGMILGAT